MALTTECELTVANKREYLEKLGLEGKGFEFPEGTFERTYTYETEDGQDSVQTLRVPYDPNDPKKGSRVLAGNRDGRWELTEWGKSLIPTLYKIVTNPDQVEQLKGILRYIFNNNKEKYGSTEFQSIDKITQVRRYHNAQGDSLEVCLDSAGHEIAKYDGEWKLIELESAIKRDAQSSLPADKKTTANEGPALG